LINFIDIEFYNKDFPISISGLTYCFYIWCIFDNYFWYLHCN